MSNLEEIKTRIIDSSRELKKIIVDQLTLKRFRKEKSEVKSKTPPVNETVKPVEYSSSEYFQDLIDLLSRNEHYSKIIDIDILNFQIQLLKQKPDFESLDHTIRWIYADKILKNYELISHEDRNQIHVDMYKNYISVKQPSKF